VALYLLNCPQYVIAYLGALKVGPRSRPSARSTPARRSNIRLEDSDAKTVVCEDILYDNVEKAGDLKLDHVILTSIGEYLPALKRLGQGAPGKAYGRNAGPHAQDHQRGLAPLPGFAEEIPARTPQLTVDPARTSRHFLTPAGPPGFPRRPC
jgi:long-chain acyl-CoA synthetase